MNKHELDRVAGLDDQAEGLVHTHRLGLSPHRQALDLGGRRARLGRRGSGGCRGRDLRVGRGGGVSSLVSAADSNSRRPIAFSGQVVDLDAPLCAGGNAERDLLPILPLVEARGAQFVRLAIHRDLQDDANTRRVDVCCLDIADELTDSIGNLKLVFLALRAPCRGSLTTGVFRLPWLKSLSGARVPAPSEHSQ